MSLRQWTLWKDGHKFSLRWRAGDEGQLLAEIADQVDRGVLPLDRQNLTALVRMIAATIEPGDSSLAAMKTMKKEWLATRDRAFMGTADGDARR